MAESSPTRHTRTLIGLGLLVVGLCAGILFMLVIDREDAPRIVESVELGQPASMAEPAREDSNALLEEVPLARLNAQFKEVAGRVTSSVVFIMVSVGDGASGDGPAEPFFQQQRPPRQSVGSGVIISEDGYIVTNNHVIEGAGEIQVVLNDKRQYAARVVGIDASTDLAVLKVDAARLPAIPLGNSDRVEVGEWVIAVGNPFRLTSTVTAGIVGALGRRVNIIEGSDSIEDFIQTDAAISPGNSGGALVNLRGELVGINTAIASRSGWYEGYGFAVPVNLMQRVARDLIEYGAVRRGYMGVAIQEVNALRAREIGLEEIRGVYISEVHEGGAADAAGLRIGDVVLAVGGREVSASNQLQSLVASYRPGERVRLTVWRAEAVRHVDIELMARDEGWLGSLRGDRSPDHAPGPPPALPTPHLFELDDWGLGLRAATEEEQDAFGTVEGAYLAYIQQGSVAGRAGLPRDVLLTAVEGVEVRSVPEALRLLNGADGASVLLRVRRRDRAAAFYEVEVP